MKCNWMLTDVILGIIILLAVFMWGDLSSWIIAIAALIIVIHAVAHNNAHKMQFMSMSEEKKTTKRKR